MKKTLSCQPPKGTSDWYGDEFRIRQAIFDVWRKVCRSYGYEEYLTPIVESAEIYRAKSGEDVGGRELMSFFDNGGRELAIRPEMTPSVTRMAAGIYESSPKPLKLFSIANFFRNEKPQRGRNREFWQLNVDVFGSTSVQADIEIIEIALDIILDFNPPCDSFVLEINSRKLIDAVLDSAVKVGQERKSEVVRIMDKKAKLTEEEFKFRLKKTGLKDKQSDLITAFMACSSIAELEIRLPMLAGEKEVSELDTILSALRRSGYGEWIRFNPAVIRGFDYYDGAVFEVFDRNPQNQRSMFGGGRYNGLAGLFGCQNMPAVGAAPGDEIMKLFLEGWGLIDSLIDSRKVATYYLPLLDQALSNDIRTLGASLRMAGKVVESGYERQSIKKALEYANRKKIANVVILGADEKAEGIYKIKKMESGEDMMVKL